MTTNEFIKMLQEADPDGNCHVRCGGGVPIFADKVPGYYDGSYDYIENGVYHVTTKESKVDIFFETIDDIVWELDGDMNQIRNKISIDDSYSSKEKWDRIEKVAVEARKFTEKSDVEYMNKVRVDMDKGYIFKEEGRGTVYKIKKKLIKDEKILCCQGEIQILYKKFKLKDSIFTDSQRERKNKLQKIIKKGG